MSGTTGYMEISALTAILDSQVQELEDAHAPPGEHARSRISGHQQQSGLRPCRSGIAEHAS